jgi:hypothetical protein
MTEHSLREGSAAPSLLRDAHKGVEAMNDIAALIKREQWIEAERALAELQSITAELTRRVGYKVSPAT